MNSNSSKTVLVIYYTTLPTFQEKIFLMEYSCRPHGMHHLWRHHARLLEAACQVPQGCGTDSSSMQSPMHSVIATGDGDQF